MFREMRIKTLFVLWILPLGAMAEVRISEFLASNNSILVPGQAGGAFHDWIELENRGAAPVDLGGWHLTDKASDLVKWTFPEGISIPAGGFLVVLANSGTGPDANGLLQTNFSLSAAGEYLALSDASATVISSFGQNGENYPPQDSDISYGISQVDGSSVFFATPTPAAANSGGFVNAGDVTLSHQRGYYSAPFSLTLTASEPTATLVYTMDGRSPVLADGSVGSYATTYTGPISIATTTILRVAATRAGANPSPVQTDTFVFPSAVATQQKPGDYPTKWGGTATGDYNVDPAVSQSTTDGQLFLDGMRDLPTISIVTSKDNLFGTAGLYLNTEDDEEKPVSAEYFDPDATVDGANGPVAFQIDCGLRIQGGASRNPGSAAKHSMSLRFRENYGASSISAKVFPGATSDFNSLHLRANYNNSWIHSDANQRRRTNHFADQWVRDSYIAMGHPDGNSGSFVHLFLNGLYWGVYNLHERPENDHFAEYSGGRYAKDDVFGYNPGTHTTEEQASFDAMKATCKTGDWTAIQAALDVDSYIDFYIIQHFAHNDDLKTVDNWRAAGGGPAHAPWKFYPWDSERTLEDPTNVGSLAAGSQDGASIINDLQKVLEFRVRFADRLYRHLYHGGALTNTLNLARVLARVNELDKAVVAESARWGDNRSGGSGPTGDYTRTDNWLPAIYGPMSSSPTGGLLGATGWFPGTGTNRTDRMIQKFKSENWSVGTAKKLPQIDPPDFLVDGLPRYGGTLATGEVLTLGGGTGTLYVTTDGSDPRDSGGAVQAGLAAYSGGAIGVFREGIVRARWKNGSDWSALAEARFATDRLAAAGELVISEVYYHPEPPSPAEFGAVTAQPGSRVATDSDFQFLEILNISTATLNLEGCTLAEGVSFTFPRYQLAPGERVVVAETTDVFPVRFPTALPPAGQWTGALANSGETISLLSQSGAAIDTFKYNDKDPWPESADGDGTSLNRLALAVDGNLAVSWAADLPTPGSGMVFDRFTNWANLKGISSDPADDSDYDGIPAILEYALSLDPLTADLLPAVQWTEAGASLEFLQDPTRNDVELKVLGCDDLSNWQEITGTSVMELDGRLRTTVEAPENAPQFFFRFRAH